MCEKENSVIASYWECESEGVKVLKCEKVRVQKCESMKVWELIVKVWKGKSVKR